MHLGGHLGEGSEEHRSEGQALRRGVCRPVLERAGIWVSSGGSWGRKSRHRREKGAELCAEKQEHVRVVSRVHGET